ncbi:MAG: heparinase II/III family protein [bacterium]|nr:heparinase II/III family protein [bacterium]
MRGIHLAFLLLLLRVAASGAQVPLAAEVHPSLLFTAEQVPLLQARITRAPYATWWATVLDRALQPPSPVVEERTKARYAKAAAFAWWMTGDSTFAHTAAGLLLDMKFPRDGGDLGEPHLEGEVVMQYAQAYDMLHPFLSSYPDSLATVRSLLADEADRMFDGIVVQEIDLGFFGTLKIHLHETTDPRNLSVTHLDNWHIRLYGSLGLVAYALADHPGSGGSSPQQWAAWAYDLVTRSLTHMIDEMDGSYAEGPFYQRYAADIFLPYAFALRSLSAIDLFTDPLLDRTHDWSVNIRLPSGRRPNIDDGHLDDAYGHYLAAVDADGPVHHWDWLHNENGPYVRGFNEPDAIVYYDDTIGSREPDRGPTIFMPAAGDAVFRTDWSPEATYLLLRGEHGRPREQGFGHEHADETSFILYAHGEMLALDGGYINFTNHDKVNWGNAHNLIMVDGQGPPIDRIAGAAVDGGEDAFIEDTMIDAGGDYAQVRAAYLGARFRRRTLFANREYFVIADEAASDSVRTYQWRLHGHGGGTSGGSYTRTGSLARWTRPQAELLAYLTPAPGRTFAEDDTIHSFDFLEEPTHTFLKVKQTGTTAEFLAVLFPQVPSAEAPLLSAAEATGGQAIRVTRADSVEEVTWVRAANANSVVIDSSGGGSVNTDAAFGWVRWESNRLHTWTIQDGTRLQVGGVARIAATDTVDVLLSASADRLSGFVRGPDSGYTITLGGIDSVTSAQFDGQLRAADHVASTGWRLALAGAGALQLTVVVAPGETTADPADFSGDGVIDFSDFFQFADVFGQHVSAEDARFDLNGDGVVDFSDFFIFADAFGR